MQAWFTRLSADASRARLHAIYAGLIAANLGAWLWTLLLFAERPVLLGTALLAYGLGLRHAVDADHIAAIDNVTRSLVQSGQRPAAVGLFFALGHSSVVIAATAAIALGAPVLATRFAALREIGGIIGTLISTSFLLAIGALNLVVLVGVWRSLRAVRRGGALPAADLDLLLNRRGLLAPLFGPLFRLVRRSWHMLPLGLLFGLGFDTASEVGLLGISAIQAAQGMAVWSIMVFPALFAASMSLIDTTDGVLMLGAYDWAFANPIRKLRYNLVVTAVSVLVALLVGGIEGFGLIADRLGLNGAFWDRIGQLNDHADRLGAGIVALFILAWIGAALAYRYAAWGTARTSSPPLKR